ncbi:MAG: hypothetical protein ACRD3T_09155 [Terriglobia bacterium]
MPQSPAGQPAAGQSGVATVGPFEFHSDFWINLHHFLYQQALQGSPESLRPNGPLAAGKLSPSEQSVWDNALTFYRQSMVEHDLLVDPGMNAIDSVLADAEGSDSLDSTGLNDELKKVLDDAAPVYRAHWWSGHDRANRFWITTATPLVRGLGPTLREQLTTAYNVPWPKLPIRVDVAVYANWAGGYTFTGDRVHTIISSVDPSYQGFAALEMLFHEASHGMVSAESGQLADLIAQESKSDAIPVPPDLVHAMIFFTAGEFARRDLASVGVTHYQPYAMKNGLYPRAGWTRYESALELYWMPHLDGKTPLDVATIEVIDALAVGQSAAVAHPEPATKK